MKELRAVMIVDENGWGRIPVNGQFTPGEHKVVVKQEIEDVPKKRGKDFLSLPPLSLGPWKKGLTFSRDDLYDDD